MSKAKKFSKVRQERSVKGAKGKRWKKGHSCATNPEIKKHRLAAKSRLFKTVSGPSKLTVDAIARHEAHHGEESHAHDAECCAHSDTQSVGTVGTIKTNCSWASQWTECTNATFGKALGRFSMSSLAQHKEVIAVLAAVTEEIKNNGGKESNTEYFAALMTIFDTELDEQSEIAVAYLLSIVIKKVPATALRARFDDIARSFANKLSLSVAANKLEGSSLTRSIIGCLSHLLSSIDRSAWATEYTVHVFRSLFPFITTPKAKVRKAAHHAMGAILRGSCFMKTSAESVTDQKAHHPAAAKLAKYCNEEMSNLQNSGNMVSLLYMLELLKDIMSEFPEKSMKLTCNTILDLLQLRNMMLSNSVLKALHSVFLMRPRPSSLSDELNKEVVIRLFMLKPNELDTQQMEPWLLVMSQAYCNWIRLNERDCISHLPDYFKVLMKCLASGNAAVARAAASMIECLLKDCIQPSTNFLEQLVQSTPHGGTSPVHKIFRYVEAGLGYQYLASWELVLKILARFFEILGRQCHAIMLKSLSSMAELRGSHGFEHKDLLDKAIGAAIRYMGPKVVLATVPLQTAVSEGDVDLSRSWLLPVLRDHVEKTELAFFAQYFLPLAAQLKSKCIIYDKTGRNVELKTCTALISQIWALLPGFCTQPTDLKTAFPLVAQTLGECISSRPDVRLEVLNALRKLSLHCTNDDERQVMGRYSKNFIPILANLIAPIDGDKADASRLATLETLKCYMKVADRKEVHNFFTKCCAKLVDESTTASRKPLLMDLLIAFVPFLDHADLCQGLALVFELVESEDRSVQKKSYRVLEEICASQSPDCQRVVKTELPKIRKLYVESVVTANQSSTAPRLRCVVHIIRQLDSPDISFIQTVLSEALLSTKATGERARTAAYELIVEIGQTMMRWYPHMSKQDVVKQYVEMMIAGLAGNPHLASCSILALTKLVHNYKAIIEDSLLEQLVDSSCLLLMSKAREVVQSAIGFVKTLLLTTGSKCEKHLTKIVSSLVSMKEDNRHHFRFKTKELFALLVRKFGYTVVYELVPESLQKMFNNMRKSDERKQRKREAASSDQEDGGTQSTRKRKHETIDELLHSSDSESDDDEETNGKPVLKKVKRSLRNEVARGGGAWLKEDEDIVDFLDPSAAKKVLATKPELGGSKTKQPVKHDFKMAADGRLIITDDNMQQGGKNAAVGDDDDDIERLLDSAERNKSWKRQKRGRDDYTDIDIDDDKKSTTTTASAYQAGGKGIHRPLRGAATEDFGRHYRAKKAGGDMKKKGKPDPYAYIPLEHQFLNKRKKAKATGQFSHLVKGARKGAQKGQKLRNKKGKSKNK